MGRLLAFRLVPNHDLNVLGGSLLTLAAVLGVIGWRHVGVPIPGIGLALLGR